MVDVFIGDPNAMGNSATAIIRFKEGGYISHNSGSYWIIDLIWGMSLGIDKNRPEGVSLARLISEIKPFLPPISLEDYPEIRSLLFTLLIRYVDVDVLVARVDSALNQAHYAGRRELQNQVRDLFVS
jgi:hypothetical protein